MNTKAVIFDLDDTLISELEYALSGYRAVSGHIASKGLCQGSPEELYRELTELFYEDHKKVFNRFLTGKGLPDDRDRVMELVEVYRCHTPDIAYYDDVKPVIKELKGKGLRTGILSDGYFVTQRAKIKALKAEEDFDPVILTDELGREYWKPSPEGFRMIEEKYSILPGEIVYVGDNPEKDFYLSQTAGIKTVRIIRKGGIYADSPYFQDVREDFRIASLKDLISILT